MGEVGVRRSFRFLPRPTGKQAAALTACLEEHRELYNTALEHRRTACRKAGVTVRYGHQPAELKHIRADDPDGQARWSFSSQQATLRRLDKAESAGRELIAVNPADTSRTCARCGHRAKENRVSQAEFRCEACGHAAHADVNAAISILRAGLALRQAAEAA
jgi:transposase